MEDGDPTKLTVQQLKSKITEMGFYDELPNTHASKEQYIEIYRRGKSKKRTAEDVAESNKRFKPESAMDVDQEIITTETESERFDFVESQQLVDIAPITTQPTQEPAYSVAPASEFHPPPAQRVERPGRAVGLNHINLAPFPSELPFIERRVQSKSERASRFYRQIAGTILLLIATRLLHYCCCTRTTFCDHEELLSATLHSGCTPCPPFGFCANGNIHECKEPYQLFAERCVSEDEASSLRNPGKLRSLWESWFCDVLVFNTFTLLATTVAILISWYWYWYCASQEEDEVVAGVLDEVTQVLSRARGQAFRPAKLLEELAVKYPDYNVERIWPQVSMLLEKDHPLVKTEASVDGFPQVLWSFPEGAAR